MNWNLHLTEEKENIFQIPTWVPLVVFFSITAFALLVGVSIKLIKRLYKKDIRIFPELNVKTITYVAMLNAASVSVVIFVSLFVPVTFIPPVRVGLEGILVKTTGYIFGPVIGLLSGVITDLLSNLLRPSYYYWGYTLIIALFGMIAGIVRAAIRVSKENKNIVFAIISVMILSIITAMGLVINFVITRTEFKFDFIGIHLALSKWLVFGVLAASLLITLIAIWFIFWYYSVKKAPYKFINLSSILILAILTEYLLDVTISPIFDNAALGISLQLAIGYHLLASPFKVWGNFVIIYTVNKITSPLINKEAYESAEYTEIEYKPWFLKKNEEYDPKTKEIIIVKKENNKTTNEIKVNTIKKELKSSKSKKEK